MSEHLGLILINQYTQEAQDCINQVSCYTQGEELSHTLTDIVNLHKDITDEIVAIHTNNVQRIRKYFDNVVSLPYVM